MVSYSNQISLGFLERLKDIQSVFRPLLIFGYSLEEYNKKIKDWCEAFDQGIKLGIHPNKVAFKNE